MINNTTNKTPLRWEIGLALLLKIILLTGLWFLLFRWQGRPAVKPDIAAHFALPTQAPIYPSTKEIHYDRR
ncbi:MAG: hypothetical protein PHH59_11060 [Methylovulum sp.]|uniref:hypothetical protein n=1 Tax=Methylovulum sp. TaxID=1916980 RepID=UPI00261C76C5|nr:hypothetical protein [Methylovulum sp.]MDD2724545.1 hypothetical protein [Methylovulum sp.]MDD5124024.1 hypothetical protein [Methylovulum sp.]